MSIYTQTRKKIKLPIYRIRHTKLPDVHLSNELSTRTKKKNMPFFVQLFSLTKNTTQRSNEIGYKKIIED